MANKTFQGRIVQKHDIKANWDKATNFVPLKGEIIIYDDLNKIKIGDGSTKINDLKFDTATFYVKVTQGTGNSVTADKTAKEIYDAYQTGYAVSAIAQFNSINYPYILPLAAINENNGIIIIGFGALGSTSLTTAPQYPTICYTGSEWQMWIGELVRNTDLATVATSGSYNDLKDKPNIPTTISQLEDDTTFIVTVTGNGTTASPYTADYTSQDILTQYSAKKKIYLSNNNILYPLVAVAGPQMQAFARLGYNNQVIQFQLASSTVTKTIYSIQTINNKVTTLDSSSTDTQYPSAKAVYDNLQNYLPLTGGDITGTLTITDNRGNSQLQLNDILFTSTTETAECNLNLADPRGRKIRLTGIAYPQNDADATNRKYVDEQIAANASSTTIITWSDDGT